MASTPPVVVPSDGPLEVHLLCGRSTVYEAIGAFKSLWRYAAHLPVVIHDDGSLRAGDVRLLESHVAGVRVILRREADVRVGAVLARDGLTRCAKFREDLVFAVKLFDLQLYGAGKTILYLDTDVLFHGSPSELLDGDGTESGAWVDRYNEDGVSCYAWPPDALHTHLGIDVLPRVNAGLLYVRCAPEPDWSLYERCLELPMIDGQLFYAEQTLWALELSQRSARPLPPSYDVALRNESPSADLVSQHYCGGWHNRRQYYADARAAVTDPPAARTADELREKVG